MDIREKKLKIIEGLLKVDDESLIGRVEALLAGRQKMSAGRSAIHDLVGSMDKSSAEEMEKLIESHCENIDDAGWK